MHPSQKREVLGIYPLFLVSSLISGALLSISWSLAGLARDYHAVHKTELDAVKKVEAP